MSKHYLYRHIREDKKEPFYIGIGTKRGFNYSCYEVEYERAFSEKGRNYIWEGITNRSDYMVEIMCESDNYDEIKDREIFFIDLYGKIIDSKGTLCNFSDGGDGTLGCRHDEETRKRISKSSIKYEVAKYSLGGELLKVYSSTKIAANEHDTNRSNIYSAMTGDTKTSMGFQWRKVKDKTKQKIKPIKSAKIRSVESRKGYSPSKETRRKMSESAKGKVTSEETKEKLRQHNLGNTVSKETRKKISDKLKGKGGVKVKHLETGRVFNTLTEGCKEFDLKFKREYARMNRDFNNKNFIRVE